MHTTDIRKKADGSPSARANAARPWKCVVLVDGRRVTGYFHTKGDADAWGYEQEAAKHRAGRQRFGRGDPRQPFGPYAQRWFDARDVRPGTVRAEQGSFTKHVLARWGEVPIVEITTAAVMEWEEELRARYSPSLVIKLVGWVKGPLQRAVDSRMIPDNAAANVKRPSPRRGQKKDAITVEDLRAIGQEMHEGRRAAAGDWDELILNLLFYCALRPSELAALEPRQLHLDADPPYITIDDAISKAGGVYVRQGTTKTGEPRDVPVPKRIVAMLATHMLAHKRVRDDLGELIFRPSQLPYHLGRGRVFHSEAWGKHALAPAVAAVFGCEPYEGARGTRYRHRSCKCRERGCGPSGVTAYSMRHSGLTYYMERTDQPAFVQQLAGHANIATTMIYSHPSKKKALQLVRKVDEDDAAWQPQDSVPTVVNLNSSKG